MTVAYIIEAPTPTYRSNANSLLEPERLVMPSIAKTAENNP